jgi:hypothetical protein
VLFKSIISGRFDKASFPELQHTLILGKDCGLYLLLNTFDPDELISDDPRITKEYLNDKVKPPKLEKPSEKMKKLIIGRGSYGIVRFAVSLFLTRNTSPGSLIFMKKTYSFKKLHDLSSDFSLPIIQQVTDATLGDYFASSNEISA